MTMKNFEEEPTENSLKLDPNVVEVMRSSFQGAWYRSTYAHDLAKFSKADEQVFDFYIRMGARMGHDPNPNFSEVYYRNSNPDVLRYMIDLPHAFGFLHYIEFGHKEENRIKYNQKKAESLRELLLTLDRDFLKTHYGSRAREYPDICDLYYNRAFCDKMSPSADFSEAGYVELNPDVEKALEARALISGYEHYLTVRRRETRKIISHDGYLERQRLVEKEEAKKETNRALEANASGVTHLLALDVLEAFEFFEGGVNVTTKKASDAGGLLVLVPHFLPEILFGGYMAFYGFLRQLKKLTGIRLNLIVTNMGSEEIHASNILRMRLKSPEMFDIFDDIQRFDRDKRHIETPENFNVISYSAEMHPIAARIAAKLGKKPIFFIQEYEPDFHANTDMRTFTENAFLLPHHAVYNSAKLVEYFKKKTSVFATAGTNYQYTAIENEIRPLSIGRDEYLERQNSKTTRRLILYGRPEAHAARNHFATLVHALRQATRNGVFDEDLWEFSAIGSLTYDQDINLNGVQKLRMMPKMPKAKYEEFLLSGDIGVSVITTPHPGIVHFQMAAFGLTTLTNRTELRDDAWLAQQNRNLLPIDMQTNLIVESFRKAIVLAEDFQSRYDNAMNCHCPDNSACLGEALHFVSEIVKA